MTHGVVMSSSNRCVTSWVVERMRARDWNHPRPTGGLPVCESYSRMWQASFVLRCKRQISDNLAGIEFASESRMSLSRVP